MFKFFTILGIFFSLSICAQNKQLLFGFKEIPQNLMVNPGAKTTFSSHFGVPILSGISAEANLKGFNLHDVFAENEVDFNTKLRRLISTLNSKDHAAFNQQLEVFNIGYKRNDKDYISFGAYQELDLTSFYPQDLAYFLYYGNTENGSVLLNKPRKISQIAFKGELISVAHLGINRQINEKLIIGARAKVYSGAYNITSTSNKGTLTTVEGIDNLYQHQLRDVNFSLKTSGLSNTENLKQDIFKRMLFSGNLGIGADLGFTYKYTNNITITGSILDVGFIAYNNDTETIKYKGNFNIDGIELFDQEEGVDRDYWQDFLDDFDSSLNKKKTSAAYLTMRPIKIYAGATYSFGNTVEKRKTRRRNKRDCSCEATEIFHKENVNEVGGQLYFIHRAKQPHAAFTAFYYRRISNFLRAKATYTADSYGFSNLGLGISTHLGNFNFYAMTDNLLGYRDLSKSQSQSFQFGLNWVVD